MTDPANQTKPELTAEEIEILKDMVKGRQAFKWLGQRSKTIAAWFAAIVGAWFLFEGIIAKWVIKLTGTGQ